MNDTYPRGIEIITGVIIRNKKGQVLLIKNSKWKDWIIPGGHVEPGETIEQCALRETKEETGLDAKFITVLGYQEIFNPPSFQRDAHFISFHCVLEVDSEDLSNADKREVSEYKWVAPEEALEDNLLEDLVHFFKQYIVYQETLKATS